MSKLYKIFFLLIILIFLTTYNPQSFSLKDEKKQNFFKIKNIVVTNNFLVKKSEIKTKLHLIYDKNIFLVRSKDIKNPLKNIDFLKKIEVKKKYPNTIIIKIFENKPIGILEKDKNKYLIDNSSNLILFSNNDNFHDLPHIFGIGVEDHFEYFLNQLNNNNFPIKKIKNFYYFQIGRWDLEFTNGKVIKFPHNSINSAIKKSVELLKRNDFENYNIIDLRVNGKIIVE